MKKNKLSKISVYVIFILGILLVASIILNIFFYAKSRIRIFDCNLGQKIEVEFFETDNIILANIVYPSNIVGGTTYDQPVVLKSSDLQNNYFVRAKAVYADYNIIGESIPVNLTPESKWLKADDGYFYLQEYLGDWAEINFIKFLTLPILSTEVKNNTIVTIYFEFLNAELDVSQLWKTPQNFFTNT